MTGAISGFVEETRNGKRVATGEPKDYRVKLVQDFRAAETVPLTPVLPLPQVTAPRCSFQYGLPIT